MTAPKQHVPFGRIEWLIAFRYLRARKHEGGVAAIALISFLCILLAIMAMITIMSIMNGFRARLLELTIGSQGHIYVLSAQAEPDAADMAALQAQITNIDGFMDVFEFSEYPVAMQANNVLAFGQVTGISKQSLENFHLISDSIIAGNLSQFGQGQGAAHQIAIGSYMAQNLGLSSGERLILLTSRLQPSAIGPPRPVYKNYTVGAIFQTGLYITDSQTIFMDYEQAALLFSGGKRSGSLQIRLDDPDKAFDYMAQIDKVVKQPIFLKSWKDKNAVTATALRTEQIAMRFIFFIVVIISTFPILAAMIMLVKNKARDIAILRTMGASRSGILRIFFMTGTMIGLAGTLSGIGLGVLVCSNMPVIQHAIELVTGVALFPPEIYQISGGIPVKLVWSEVVTVALSGLIFSSGVTFLPALMAAQTDPVEALRYE